MTVFTMTHLGDDYHHYLDSRYNSGSDALNIVNRYTDYNGTEGNSFGTTTSIATGTPDLERYKPG